MYPIIPLLNLLNLLEYKLSYMLRLKLRSMVTQKKKYDKSFKTKAVELSFARNNVNEVA